MPVQTDFPRLNVVVADEETAAPIEGASVEVEVDGETDEEKTVDNESWEGVAAFKIAPTYESVQVRVSHDLFEEEVAEVEINRDVTTEVFELSTLTSELTISPPRTIEQNLDMKLVPKSQQVKTIWGINVCDITVFPDSDEVISLPLGKYHLEVLPVDGEHLVSNPSRTFTVDQNSPMTLDFQAPSVKSLPELQSDQMEEILYRVEEVYGPHGNFEDDVDSAVPEFLLSPARKLADELEAALTHGLPARLCSVAIEDITETYLDTVSHAIDDIRAPMLDETGQDLFRVASKLEPVDAEWTGPASFAELRDHLNKSPEQAVNDFEAIRNRVNAELSAAEPDLAHPEPLLDVFAALETPEADESVELITRFFVLSRFWLAIEDVLKNEDLRARFDVMAGDDQLDELENPERFQSSEDESGGGFFSRF